MRLAGILSLFFILVDGGKILDRLLRDGRRMKELSKRQYSLSDAPPAKSESLNSPKVQTLLNMIMGHSAQDAGHQVANDYTTGKTSILAMLIASAPKQKVQHDGTEAGPNLHNAGQLYEIDIRLTEEQAQEKYNEVMGNRRVKRQLTTLGHLRWPKGVVHYRFGTNGGSSWRETIRSGMDEWADNTCVRFQEGGRRDYVNFIYGDGCYSTVGKGGGAQDLSIGDDCDLTGIVSHEVGHALGLWHQQSRPDRGTHIKILNHNIQAGAEGNFLVNYASHDEDVAYDLGSVMHYGPSSFSSRGRTLEPKDSLYLQTVGQRNNPSFLDFKIINTAYCSDVCRGRNKCKNGGYLDPKDCSKCRCPTGLGGNCDEVAKSTKRCGGEITVSSSWKTISSRTRKAVCYWLIKSPDGSPIEVDFTRVNYDQVFHEKCSSFVEVKYMENLEQTGARFCEDKPRGVVKTESGTAILIHDTSLTSGSFSARVRCRNCRASRKSKSTKAPSRSSSGQRNTPWTSWSKCSEDCGACGIRTREQMRDGRKMRRTQVCNTKPCPSDCEVILSVPCNVAGSGRYRSFDPRAADFAVVGIPTTLRDGEKVKVKAPSRASGVAADAGGRRLGGSILDWLVKSAQERDDGDMCDQSYSYECNREQCCNGRRIRRNRCVP